MIRVEIDITIHADPDTIFEFISNIENNPKWQSGMKNAEFITDPPLRIGSKYKQIASFLGKKIESVFEVIEYNSGQSIKAKSIGGSFPITFTRIVKRNSEGHSIVSALIEGEAEGFFKLAEKLMEPIVKKTINQDYKKLKELMENK